MVIGNPPFPRCGADRRARRPAYRLAILTVLIGISVGYLATSDIIDGLRERHVIYSGVPVRADIVEVAGTTSPAKAIDTHGSPGERTIRVKYEAAGADPVEGVLQTSRYQGFRVGQKIDIRFDPANPKVWTDQTEPQPWSTRLAMVWMLLPALIFTVLMMLVRRRQMLSIWREGTAVPGTVVDLKQSAIAPHSRVVRFTLNDAGDRRIGSTFFPLAAGELQKGDELVLIVSPTNRARAIVAELYEELKD